MFRVGKGDWIDILLELTLRFVGMIFGKGFSIERGNLWAVVGWSLLAIAVMWLCVVAWRIVRCVKESK
jgi:hypothetical protein